MRTLVGVFPPFSVEIFCFSWLLPKHRHCSPWNEEWRGWERESYSHGKSFLFQPIQPRASLRLWVRSLGHMLALSWLGDEWAVLKVDTPVLCWVILEQRGVVPAMPPFNSKFNEQNNCYFQTLSIKGDLFLHSKRWTENPCPRVLKILWCIKFPAHSRRFVAFSHHPHHSQEFSLLHPSCINILG